MASSSVAPSTTTTSTVDYKNERDVVDAYTRLRQELSSLVDRVSDLESQLVEHALVAKTMRPMEKGRKAYRLVGDVLVERTVGEVLPAVEQNLAQIEEVLNKLRGEAEKKDRELAAHLQKYKIRVSSGQEQEAAAAAAAAGGGGGGSGQQGVLV